MLERIAFSDQEIINRFPVGYYPLHPNVSLNFQMNRFWNWVGDKQMLVTAPGSEFGTQADEGGTTPGSVLINRLVPFIRGVIDAGIKLELLAHRVRSA